jgi:hypothetical protein
VDGEAEEGHLQVRLRPARLDHARSAQSHLRRQTDRPAVRPRTPVRPARQVREVSRSSARGCHAGRRHSHFYPARVHRALSTRDPDPAAAPSVTCGQIPAPCDSESGALSGCWTAPPPCASIRTSSPTQDGTFMEPSGRNWWQPVANGSARRRFSRRIGNRWQRTATVPERMVRRGSTVRVRQRASTIPCKWVFVTRVARACDRGRTRSQGRRQCVLTPLYASRGTPTVSGAFRRDQGQSEIISGLPARGPRRSVCAMSVIMNCA